MSLAQPRVEAAIPQLPFMHIDRCCEDLTVVNHLVGRLRAALHSGLLDRPVSADGAVTFEWDDDDGLHQRIIRRTSLKMQSSEKIFIVGFFGQHRADADRTEIQRVDRELIADLGGHVDILCYFTSALPTSEFGNLVLSRTEEARVQWSNDPRHVYAVRELSPHYYHSIRLHNGVLETGLACARGAMLTRTKFFAYDLPAGAPMRFVREWSPPLMARK